jgi:hypothetical protein
LRRWRLINGECGVGVDGQAITSTAVLGGIACANHAAVRVGHERCSIAQEIITEALGGILQACNAVSGTNTGVHARLYGQRLAVRLLVEEGTPARTLAIATLVGPRGR